MAAFVYRAANRRGQTIDGVMEAPDMRAVIEQLQRDTYYPIQVTPRDAAGRDAAGRDTTGQTLRPAWTALGARRVTGRDLDCSRIPGRCH